MAGRFPLTTDESVDGPYVRTLQKRGWDVLLAAEDEPFSPFPIVYIRPKR